MNILIQINMFFNIKYFGFFNFKGLSDLTLSANPSITTRGWSQFFIAMASSCTLRTLNLDYNMIGDYGIGCLAVALAGNRSLEIVDLEGTGISEQGAKVQYCIYFIFYFLYCNIPISRSVYVGC